MSASKSIAVASLVLLTTSPCLMAQDTSTASLQPNRVSELEPTSGSQSQFATIAVEISIAIAGTYVLSAPADSRLQVRANGALLFDAGLTRSGNSTEAISAITTLAAGRHAIEITGADTSLQDIASVSVRRVGDGEAVSLASLAVAGTPEVQNQPVPSAMAMGTSRLLAGVAASNNAQPTQSAAIRSRGPATAITQEGSLAAINIRNVINDARAIAGLDPIDTTPPVIYDDALSSPLSPPAGVVLTQAIEITGGATRTGKVAATGQTLFGGVMDPMTYDTIIAVMAPSGRTTTVDVGRTTGQFAIRLFPEDLTSGNATVTLTGASSGDSNVLSQPVSYDFEAAAANDGVGQALSRITFGATADLYAHVRAIGYEAYIEEQLNPQSIPNTAFNAANFDDLFLDTYTNRYWMFRSLERHNLAHAAFSDRQLQEIMSEFWYNHFHASTKSSYVYHQTIEDRAFFRENALGQFEDLLLYSARSPLMSQFLDNDLSSAGALNENYGREILELHTVGLNADYGDADVIAVSRLFTGWNYRLTNPGYGTGKWPLYEFEFRADDHDTDDKVIPFLETTITGRSGEAGVEEAEELIAILANHEETQRHICGKLVQRFVADIPPENFVSLCVGAWQDSDGNTQDMLRAILLAPAFISTPDIQRNKVKTPFEYAASILRIIDAYPGDDLATTAFFERMLAGMEDAGYKPVYFAVPTGLPEVAEAWVNSGSLIARYRGANPYVQYPDTYNVETHARITELGLETAEEVASFLLAISTGDRFQRNEFEAIVDALKWSDGIFDPMSQDETRAYARALGLLVALPSVQLQ